MCCLQFAMISMNDTKQERTEKLEWIQKICNASNTDEINLNLKKKTIQRRKTDCVLCEKNVKNVAK